MDNPIRLSEKYERNGWPSLPRPDLTPPVGFDLPFLTSLERIRSHRLSPNGGTIAYVKDGENSSDIFFLESSGGWPVRVTVDRPISRLWDDEIPQWSPDGLWLAYGYKDHVHVMPGQGGVSRQISDFVKSASDPQWMPDSKSLIVTIERQDIDQLVITDRDGSLPRALTLDSKGDHWNPRPSSNGNFIVFVYRRLDDLNRFDIVAIDLVTNQARTLYGKPSTRASHPRPSPDGKWIAFLSQESGYEEIWMIRPDGEGLHQLTKMGKDIRQFEWSPDSNSLAVIVNNRGAYELGLLEVGSGTLSILVNSIGIHQNPNWSPDGNSLTFEYESAVRPPDLFRIDINTRNITQVTFSMPLVMGQRKFIQPEFISYKSYDGLEIPAFLFRPDKPNGAAILFAHGGPKDQYLFSWDELAQYFTAKGYFYLAPNYRGSVGYGLDFERANYSDWGHGDKLDCLYGARYLKTITGINSERIGIIGGSYGGYLAINCLAGDPEYLFSCGISNYGDANLISSWAQCERRLRFYTEIFLGHPANHQEVYKRGSPIYQVQQIQKPLLILHGLEDTVCPPESSEELVEALRKEGKTFEYKTYAGEPHGFLNRAHQLDAYERIERFFDWYLWPGSHTGAPS